jgi:hypothetical protein
MVPDYYRELGASPDASAAELRRAYRERARRLHPDLNPAGTGADAMRRLNEAWKVLGDPESRRRYDRGLPAGNGRGAGAGPDGETARADWAWSHGWADSADSADAAGSADELPDQADWAGGIGGRAANHRLRPSWWLVAVAVLLVIFVITAYAAGPAPVNRTPGSGRPPENQCLARFPGYEGFVPCSEPNLGRVVTEYPVSQASPSCPAGTVAHQVLGRAEVVCLATGG